MTCARSRCKNRSTRKNLQSVNTKILLTQDSPKGRGTLEPMRPQSSLYKPLRTVTQNTALRADCTTNRFTITRPALEKKMRRVEQKLAEWTVYQAGCNLCVLREQTEEETLQCSKQNMICKDRFSHCSLEESSSTEGRKDVWQHCKKKLRKWNWRSKKLFVCMLNFTQHIWASWWCRAVSAWQQRRDWKQKGRRGQWWYRRKGRKQSKTWRARRTCAHLARQSVTRVIHSPTLAFQFACGAPTTSSICQKTKTSEIRRPEEIPGCTKRARCLNLFAPANEIVSTIHPIFTGMAKNTKWYTNAPCCSVQQKFRITNKNNNSVHATQTPGRLHEPVKRGLASLRVALFHSWWSCKKSVFVFSHAFHIGLVNVSRFPSFTSFVADIASCNLSLLKNNAFFSAENLFRNLRIHLGDLPVACRSLLFQYEECCSIFVCSVCMVYQVLASCPSDTQNKRNTVQEIICEVPATCCCWMWRWSNYQRQCLEVLRRIRPIIERKSTSANQQQWGPWRTLLSPTYLFTSFQ